MLGKIAKKLRLLGFDSLYSSNIDDDELLRIAKKENRVLITKDVALLAKATKQQIPTIPITKNQEIDQLCQINEKVNLNKLVISGSISRCSICNDELRLIEKNDVLGKVPASVYEKMKEFWICMNCKKIYWEGTHIRNLQKFTAELNDRLS